MSIGGGSYPPGCSGTPYDDIPDPHPLSEEICGLLEAGDVDQETIDRICKGIDDLAVQAEYCPECERRRNEAEKALDKEIDSYFRRIGETRERRRPHVGYSIVVGTYSSGEQVVSVMDDEGRSRSLSPDDAEHMADQLREAADRVRTGRGREHERRWKIEGKQ